MNVNGLIDKLIGWVYAKIYRENINLKASHFIKNVGYLFLSFGIAKIFLLLFQIYIGRALRPGGYGKFSLVYSLAMITFAPMALVNTAMIKYASEDRDEASKRTIFSTALILLFISSAAFIIILFLSSKWLSAITKLNQNYILASMVMAFSYVFYLFSMSLHSALHEVKKIAILEITRASLAICLILFLFYSFEKSPRVAILAFCLAYLGSSFLILPYFKKYLSLNQFDMRWAKKLLRFGSYTFFAGIFTAVVINIDRFFIKHFLFITDVGIYQACSYATLGLVEFFTLSFLTLFFPEASRGNKRKIWIRIEKLTKTIPVLYILILASGVIIIKFYGTEYFHPILFFFPLAAVFFFFCSLYRNFMASFGMEGMRIQLCSILFVAIFNVALNYLLIPRIGLLGAVSAKLISYLIGMLYSYYIIKTRLNTT